MVNTTELKAQIVRSGYNQKTLAKAAKMSVNSLNAKINGRKPMHCDEADILCKLLGITDPVEKVNIFLP